ncbi:MAG: protein kinase [Chloroflexi bacterium]|nr:protein kinase [Chloroflexota bacterium]
MSDQASTIPVPTMIGRYKIQRPLGKGGMAYVYVAQDPSIDREVVIKLMPPQLTLDDSFSTRFQREAQVIAKLEHPYIVPIYDFGEHNGQPYIVMRFMTGGTLSDHMLEGPLDLMEIGKIMSRLADALDEAHRLGIIHRDIKPANILFDRYGEAYLADFGIVKFEQEGSNITGTAIIGTPAYMSPEQARGERDIDGRSDIYALGVVLYEMLIGKQPFTADTPLGVLMKHVMDATPDISVQREDLPDGMEYVVQRALAKRPEQRYQTAEALVADYHRVIGGDAPTMGPIPVSHDDTMTSDSTTVLPGSAVRRSDPPRSATPVWAVVLVAIAVIAVLLVALDEDIGLFQASVEVENDPVSESEGSAQDDPTDAADGSSNPSESAFDIDQVALENVDAQIFPRHELAANAVAYSPDGSQVASASDDATIVVCNIATGSPDALLITENDPELNALAWSPEGGRLAAGDDNQVVTIWDVMNGTVSMELLGHEGAVLSLDWVDDTLVSGATDDTVILWNPETGEPKDVLRGHTDAVWAVAISPDRQMLATGGADDTVIVWSLSEGYQRIATIRDHSGTVWDVAFSPDNRYLATASDDRTVIVYDVINWDTVATLEGHTDRVEAIGWSPDSSIIASGGADYTLITWDIESGEAVQQYVDLPGEVNGVAWRSQGDQIAFVVGSSMSAGDLVLLNVR